MLAYKCLLKPDLLGGANKSILKKEKWVHESHF